MNYWQYCWCKFQDYTCGERNTRIEKGIVSKRETTKFRKPESRNQYGIKHPNFHPIHYSEISARISPYSRVLPPMNARTNSTPDRKKMNGRSTNRRFEVSGNRDQRERKKKIWACTSIWNYSKNMRKEKWKTKKNEILLLALRSGSHMLGCGFLGFLTGQRGQSRQPRHWKPIYWKILRLVCNRYSR